MIKGFLGNDNWLKKLVDALTKRVGSIENNLLDGVIFSQNTKAVALRDRKQETIDSSPARTELVGTVADVPMIHVVEFDHDQNVVNLAQMYFDGNDFVFKGVKNSGAEVIKSFGNVQTQLNNKVNTNDSRLSDARTPKSHTHDDRYYTETEVNNKLAAIPVIKQKSFNVKANGTVDTGIAMTGTSCIINAYQTRSANSADPNITLSWGSGSVAIPGQANTLKIGVTGFSGTMSNQRANFVVIYIE